MKMAYFLLSYKPYPYIAFNPNLCVNFVVKASKVSGSGLYTIVRLAHGGDPFYVVT